jgi:hypothetical protein
VTGACAGTESIKNGSGDYTAERADLLGSPSVAELRAALQRLREEEAKREEPGTLDS